MSAMGNMYKKLIMDFIEARADRDTFYGDISTAFDMDIIDVVRFCNELEEEGLIG